MNSFGGRLACAAVLTFSLTSPTLPAVAQQQGGLGLTSGLAAYRTAEFEFDLVRSSQTVGSLRPISANGFDFTPADWLERRAGNGYHHLGDVTLRLRQGDGEWVDASTARSRRPVTPLEAGSTILAAADLSPTLPEGFPIVIRRFWEVEGGNLVLRFEIENAAAVPVEVGALGFPMVFNNILHGRDLEDAHATASFHDPYIGMDAGYVQVSRLSGEGPVLLVIPMAGTPLEAWNPLLSDSTRRGITFEGFYEWMTHSAAYAQEEWSGATPWNPPTAAVLEPGAVRSYGLRFVLAESVRDIERTLRQAGRPVAVGTPGYVVPLDQDARLFLQADTPADSLIVEPSGALGVEALPRAAGGWQPFVVRGRQTGRARLTVRYASGEVQTIHYKVIQPATAVLDSLGHFLTTEQWIDDPDDPFGRAPGIISYDHSAGQQVREDHRAWIAGLGDEAGSGSWLAAIAKQLLRPDRTELARIERFVDETLWGGLQYDAGELKYGVRKSLFYWEPDDLPPGTYSSSVPYGGWSSWTREHAASVGRSFNYVHVAAAYWVLYRLARTREGLVTNHPWDWYLERAWRTGVTMAELAPEYAQFGQMEGTVYVNILRDLVREEWTDAVSDFESVMQGRAEHWQTLSYPFGSEMPWDSTGQEEVYAWCQYFGFDEKAAVTLGAVLAYMPTLPHWGYNGSARRYWDFLYAGHPASSRVERQLHHYGSGLNALPVMTEFRSNPDDLYLLRVGYGGVLGSIANVTELGFGPSGFHAWPETLEIDGYSGDFGPGFLGHVLGSGSYVFHDRELGWLGFGGTVSETGQGIRLKPRDSGRSRVYVAPLGLWLTLDAGTFEQVTLGREGDVVTVSVSQATVHTPRAFLRIERPGAADGRTAEVAGDPLVVERGAFVIPLSAGPTILEIRVQ